MDDGEGEWPWSGGVLVLPSLSLLPFFEFWVCDVVYLLSVSRYPGPWLDPRLVHLAYLVFISVIFLFHLDSECCAIMRWVYREFGDAWL